MNTPFSNCPLPRHGLLLALWLLVLAKGACAQNHAVDSFSFSSGGGASTGGVSGVSGTIAPRPMSGGGFSITAKFSGLLATDPPPGMITPIFDNAEGTENGGIGATDTKWLAGRFGPGLQSWQLDSLSLLLSNGRFDGQPIGSSTVKLQLYANDPATGKPSTGPGAVMILTDVVNPFPVAYHQWVKWIPATPFLIKAHTSYWAVFSVESGPSAGLLASFTNPSGDAGTFGVATSLNAGATWETPDDSVNFKMLIKGLPAMPPATAFEFRITGVERVGKNLRLSFNSLAGLSYAIQTSADLSSASWITVPGITVSGTGGIIQLDVPVVAAGRQFYRVLQQP